MLATGEVSAFGYCGHRNRELDAPQSLEGLDHWPTPPGLYLVCAFLLEALKPCGVLGHGADVFLEDDLLGWRGTDDLAESPEVSRPPGGPACIPNVLPQEQRFAPKLRGLEIVDSIFTRPAQVTHRFILHLGHVDRGEISRAHQTGQLDGVSSVGFDPIPGLFRDQRRCDDPADMTFFRQRAVEPIPTRAGCIDKDEVFTFGLELTDECLDVTLTGPNISDRDDLRVVFLGNIGNSNELFVDIQSDVKRARLMHG